ncbi:hypothetical protein [Peterkaempfera sp. SMS 1(5)a]|uniref:hypothetical protein n=1 Tax=Peterkaempfera podocarpi TaxID=3232308 RepID=UPI00366A8875
MSHSALHPSRRHRGARRAASLFLVATAAISTAGTAQADIAQTGTTQTGTDSHSGTNDPTGTWDVTVTVDTPQGPSVADDVFVFAADHQLHMDGPPGPDGVPQFGGDGFWESRPDGSLSFYITHPFLDGGPYPGAVQAVHIGTVHGNHLSTSAVAFVSAGSPVSLQGPIEVSSTGTRVSTAG